MGGFILDFIPQFDRNNTQKDVFEIHVPISFKMIDGQYVIRLNTSFDYYKADSITLNVSGFNILRFVIGK